MAERPLTPDDGDYCYGCSGRCRVESDSIDSGANDDTQSDRLGADEAVDAGLESRQ